MAGMLPGVESARRRRFHQGGSMNSTSGLRRMPFGLYTPGLEPSLSSNSTHRSMLSKEFHDRELGNVAREAKGRLDERLRTQRATEIKRHNSMGGGVGGAGVIPMINIGNVQREVFSLKKGLKKFSWGKLGWKASEQRECAVCLEEFKTGEILINLPCAHRFHWSCVVPWLESSSHCPCCRMTVCRMALSQ